MHPYVYFIAAFFTIAKIWKQLECLFTVDEWRKKVWYIDVRNEILLGHKKDEILPFCKNMGDLRGYNAKCS